MRLPEPLYNSVPGIYIIFGLAAVYFGSEAIWFDRGFLLAGLLFISGLSLIINGFLVLRARRKAPEPRSGPDKQPV
jgi:hypothetical protein